MDKDQAKKLVKARLADYLKERHGIQDPRKPFKCLNPQHQDKHPSMTIDEKSAGGPYVHCFACGTTYDLIDLIKLDNGYTNVRDAFEHAYRMFGLEVDGRRNATWQGPAAPAFKPVPATAQETSPSSETPPVPFSEQEQELSPEASPIDFSEAVRRYHATLLNSEIALKHFRERGISDEIIERYQLGYLPGGLLDFYRDFPELERTHVRVPQAYTYVFPHLNAAGKFEYVRFEIADRSLNSPKYLNLRKLNLQLFNERYLLSGRNAPEVVFICEGLFDALSVESAGGFAIATPTSLYRRFNELCKHGRPRSTFVLSMDSDGPGQEAQKNFRKVLDERGLPYIAVSPRKLAARSALSGAAEKIKDFNDFARADFELFRELLRETEDEARAARGGDVATEAERLEHESLKASTGIDSYLDRMRERRAAILTGFPSLDRLLGGGLYPGLYVMGAVSSLGKTTLMLQIADQIAASGTDVIFISLEMAKDELIAKSVSRLSYRVCREMGDSQGQYAVTVRDVLSGATGSPERDHRIVEGLTRYREAADHLFVLEGIGNVGVEEIRSLVERHVRVKGQKPVVMIDYLQILTPLEERMTDKQATDRNVVELKRLSRDFDTVVMTVSSFNRENYTAPVSMRAFKESGAVEYSSDVLIGLQHCGMDYEEGEGDAERKKRVTDLLAKVDEDAASGRALNIQVKVLKARTGVRGAVELQYLPRFNAYMEKERVSGGLGIPLSSFS